MNTTRKERFYSENDFDRAKYSDADLVNKLGFSSRCKKGGYISRGEEDYLHCYESYLIDEINFCKKNHIDLFLEELLKLLSVVFYIFNARKFGVFSNEKESETIAKLKKHVRVMIVQYNECKFFSNNVAYAA